MRPQGVLFDFGGVLVDGLPRDDGYAEVAEHVVELLNRHRSNGLDRVQIEGDIRAGMAAYEAWKYAQSRRAEPVEVTHRQFWEEFVAADWPRGARLAVAAHAVPLCNFLEDLVADRPARDGMLQIVERLAQAEVPLGLISNSLGAHCRRRLVAEHGFDRYFGVQIYSDEIGIRKPHPQFFHWGCDSIGVAPAHTWYVGDTLDRDILGARRAGIGRAILIDSSLTGAGPEVTAKPDDIVPTAEDLWALFETVL
jgi:N-acetyl-D-muramate 6-phosphate phosphatase